MAYLPTKWYVNFGDGATTGHWAITAWDHSAVKAAGAIVRQAAADVAALNERAFICIVHGTTHASTHPTWVLTKGATTTDADITWMECTGQPAVNGDVTNTPPWATSQTAVLGQIIKSTDASHYYICTTAGAGHTTTEPTWNHAAGETTTDGAAAIWTCIGAVGAFSAWGAPFARLSRAFTATWGAAGDTFWVSHSSLESYAGNATYTSPGTAALPCYVLCVNDATAPPTALDTTATFGTTTTNQLILIGFMYMYGFTFQAGSASSESFLHLVGTNTSKNHLILDTCELYLRGAASTSYMRLGNVASSSSAAGAIVELVNTNIRLTNAGQFLYCQTGGTFEWRGGSLLGTAPTNLLKNTGGFSLGVIRISGVDLSIIGSAKYLFSTQTQCPIEVYFSNCKLGASVGVLNAALSMDGERIYLDNCDSGDTNYRMEHYKYQGSIVVDTATYKTGGASDGTTSISHKMVSLATGPVLTSPLRGVPITAWNETVGSAITVTVDILHDSATNLTDADVWLEVEYLGTSGVPYSLFINDRMTDIMATPADQTASASAWTEALANDNKQKLVCTFTPQEKGLIRAVVCLAKANYTVYVDPLLVIT